MKRIKVAVIFGGKSAEHEVSLQSAKNIIAALDKEKYEPILIGINKKGQWLISNHAVFLLNQNNTQLVAENLELEKNTLSLRDSKQLIDVYNPHEERSIDVVFPVLHGPFGEDGTIQGLLKMAHVPFVGASVLGSAIGMDKDVMKRLLKQADIPVASFLVYHSSDRISFEEVKSQLGLPVFVKPANLGSSFGVTKVKDEIDFKKAIREAFLYDQKILIEEAVTGREIECSVLGNNDPIASLPGEIKPKDEFYTYRAKYTPEFLETEIPVNLSEETTKLVQELAKKAFKSLCCEGMARVDFFLKENGEVLINEINTIPGFTAQSVYPKLWEVSGISQTELLDRLIQLAIERFQREQKLKS